VFSRDVRKIRQNITMKGISGEIIAARYEISGKLGEGGFGKVFLARQISMNRDVVIKTIRSNINIPDSLKERFYLEATAVSRLKHPNIITYYDFGQDSDGDYFLVMELLDGKSLLQEMRKNQALPLSRIIFIVSQIAEALHEAHINGIIHRDVKPNNIFLLKRGVKQDFVKLIDFGILALRKIEPSLHTGMSSSSRNIQEKLTRSGVIMGTPEYLAPEMIIGDDYDFRVDQYALGLILYEMLTGFKPFESGSPVEIMIRHVNDSPIPLSQNSHGKNYPDMLEKTVMRCLEKNPDQRFENMLMFRNNLLNAVHDMLDTASIEETEIRKEPFKANVKQTKIKKTSDENIRYHKQKPVWKIFAVLFIFSSVFLGLTLYFLTESEEPNNKNYPESYIDSLSDAIFRIKIDKPAAIKSYSLPSLSETAVKDAPPEIASLPDRQGKGSAVLSLNAFPWAIVKVNGKEAGKTPVKNFSIPAGKCIIVLEHPDFETRKLVFAVKKGEDIKKFVNMKTGK
jgi:serine/threonine-protein kinase